MIYMHVHMLPFSVYGDDGGQVWGKEGVAIIRVTGSASCMYAKPERQSLI